MVERKGGKKRDIRCVYSYISFSHVLIFLLGKLELQMEGNKVNYFGKDYCASSTDEHITAKIRRYRVVNISGFEFQLFH